MKRFLCCIKGSSSSQQPPEYHEDELVYVPNVNLPERTSPLVTFQWQEIIDGTENFLESNVLGQGSFGKVYRCNLPRINTVAAVKVEKMEHQIYLSEYNAEITTLHSADHPNVIKLLGNVPGEEHRALIYELVSNGSLDKHLYAEANLGQFQPPGDTSVHRTIPSLDWATRMKIAIGVADALVYLHKNLKLIHRDVKVSNVLVDDNFVPKLTDFGLATKVLEDDAGVEVPYRVTPVKGTPGFEAPEVGLSGTVSTKSDVYSYGVFLLALFTGKKAFDPERALPTWRLTEWMRQMWSRENRMSVVLDHSLRQRFSVEGFVTLFRAIRLCIDSNPKERPTMEHARLLIGQAAHYPATQSSSGVFSS